MSTTHAATKTGQLARWISTTNHKDIGTLYLWASMVFFIVGGFMAMLIRARLANIGVETIQPEFYNQLVTMHGLVMIFGAIMPAWAGFANWLIPMQIGAPDMAFPRLNNWSFWLLIAGLLVLTSSIFSGAGWPGFGWTAYPPHSLQYVSVNYFIFAIHILGISSVLASINIVVTIMKMRAPGMTYMRMPMFVWSWFVTAYLLIAVVPVLAGTVTMLLFDHNFGTGFFATGHGGDPIMYEHLFWFFGHPEVYILILPAFGVISHVIPTFSRKPLFGYHCMVYAIFCIAILGMVVWAHHMFTSGITPVAKVFFMIMTLIVAVPTGVKIFNWLATMFKGVITFEPPMMFAIAFILHFTFGGLSGVMQAIVTSDIQYHDTYFVVAHFHYVLVTGSYFAIIAGIYYWLPKFTGRMYSHYLALLHFWLSVVFVNVTFLPQHFLGLAGMPRRYVDYPLAYTSLNELSTYGAFLFGLSQLIFFYIIIKNAFGSSDKKATSKVWEGAHGLEFTLTSPPPHHSFSKPPKFTLACNPHD